MGQRLLTHVDRVLEEVSKLDSDMGYFLGRKRAQIRVAVLSTVAVMPPGHDWAGRATVTLRELTAVPLIFTPRGSWFDDIWLPVLKQRGLQLNPRFELTGYAAIMELVRKGIAVALVPISAVDGSLPVAKVVEPEVQRTLGWLEPAALHAQPAMDDLKHAVRTHLENLRAVCNLG
jgi:DNA-binding transcriptional LysR family regulator